MTSILPFFPKMVFCYLEPLSLVAGAVSPLIDINYFVSSQIPKEKPHSLYPSEQVLALQLGSMYFAMFLIVVLMFNATTDSRVVLGYLYAVGFADITHVSITCYMMGYKGVMDIGSWSATAWGNVAFPIFLLVTRSLTIAGFFGPDKPKGRKTRKKN